MTKFKKSFYIIFFIFISLFICYRLIGVIGSLYIKRAVNKVSQNRVHVERVQIGFNLHSVNVRFNNVSLLIQNRLHGSAKIKTILVKVKLRPLFDKDRTCIEIEKGIYDDIKIVTPHLPLYIKDSVLHIHGIKLKLAEGEAELSGKLNFFSPYGIEFDSIYKIKNVDIQKLASKFGIKNLTFSGALNCEGDIRSCGNSIDEIRKNLNGSLDITLNNGYLTRQHILVRMFTLINMYDVIKLRLPKMDKEGIKYNTATAKAIIESGIIDVKSLYIDGERIRISGKGDINLVKESTNMVFGVELFQIIDEVLNKIPIIGYIITGENGNLFTFYVRLKSSKDGLKVTVVPYELLEDITVRLFQRLLNLPLTMMKSIKKK